MLDVISRFSDFSWWVRGIAVIWVASTVALILIELFIKPISTKETPKEQFTQTLTDQSPTKLSDKDIEKIVNKLSDKLKPLLQKEYPLGTVHYGVYNQKIVKPHNPINGNLYVNWENASVTEPTDNRISITIPYIKYKDLNTVFINTTFILPKKRGAKFDKIKMGKHRLIVELIDIVNDVAIIGIGLKKDLP